MITIYLKLRKGQLFLIMLQRVLDITTILQCISYILKPIIHLSFSNQAYS
jgi:hypothetical protein